MLQLRRRAGGLGRVAARVVLGGGLIHAIAVLYFCLAFALTSFGRRGAIHATGASAALMLLGGAVNRSAVRVHGRRRMLFAP